MQAKKSPQFRGALLLIAEKCDQAQAYARALLARGWTRSGLQIDGVLEEGGRPCRIVWADGHVLEPVEPDDIDPRWGGRWTIESLPMFPEQIPERMRPGKHAHYQTIVRGLGQASEVVNACDAGREGELIFARILTAHFGGRPPESLTLTRLWIGSLQPEDVRAAFAGRRSAYATKFVNLRQAAFASAECDWLWGYNLTRYATIALQERWQGRVAIVGRVKTPTLFEVVSKERERHAWVRERFYCVRVRVRGTEDHAMHEHDASLVAFPDDRHGDVATHFRHYDRAREFSRELLMTRVDPWSVQNAVEDIEEHPPSPFDLVDLQRCAFRLFGWTARHTLQVAQKLYSELQAITYPRTASRFIRDSMIPAVSAMREQLYNAWALDRFPALREHPLGEFGNKWVSDAKCREHHAILPTGHIPNSLDAEGRVLHEYLLWELIAVRTILAWAPPAKVTKTSRSMLRDIGGGQFLRISEDAEPVDEPGWLLLEAAMMNTKGYGKKLADRMREKALPDLGPIAHVVDVRIYEGQTTCPESHTEESLLGWMHRAEIGTPATRSECIEELIDADYIVRLGDGVIVPTPTGAELAGFLEESSGGELVAIRTSAQLQETVERMAGMSKDRPTPEEFRHAVLERIEFFGHRICSLNDRVLPAYCPRTGKPPIEDPTGKWWLFAGFPEAKCYKEFGGRAMQAYEWARVLGAGESGAGPFTGFVSRKTGNEYDAKIAWRRNLRRFEFVFSSRASRH